MTVSPSGKTSKMQFDGALVGEHQFGRTAFASAAVDNIGYFIAPCDLTIQKLLVTVLASTTSTNAEVAVGSRSASGTYHGAIALNAKAAGTVVEPDMTVATGKWTKVEMTKGETLKLKTKAATAAGSFAATLVYAPTVGV